MGVARAFLDLLATSLAGGGNLWHIHHSILKCGLSKWISRDLIHELTVLVVVLHKVELVQVRHALGQLLGRRRQSQGAPAIYLGHLLLAAAHVLRLGHRNLRNGRITIGWNICHLLY